MSRHNNTQGTIIPAGNCSLNSPEPLCCFSLYQTSWLHILFRLETALQGQSMCLCCPPAITLTLWHWETRRRMSMRRQQSARSSTSACPAAASMLSLLQRLVRLQNNTHTPLTRCVFFSKLISFSLTAKQSTETNSTHQHKTFLPLPVFYVTEAGLMLSHWKLPQSLVNLGQHLRSHLTGGRSFPGGLIWNWSESNRMLGMLSNAQN